MSKEQPIFGIDVHPEYQRGLNFERARTEGYEFCVIKATEGPYRDGDRYVPSGFKEYYRRAEAEGFVMGVYAFLLSTPARAQADHFLSTIEAVGGPEDKILMVDFEEYPAPYGYLTPGNDQLMAFVAEVKRRVGDHPVVLYSGRGFWNGGDSSGDFGQYGADAAWDAMYLDMSPHSRPRDYYDDVRHRGWGEPWGGVEPWFWQFTSAGGVAGMNIDVNTYRGTREQLLALTGLEGPTIADGEGTEEVGDGRTGGGKRVLTHGVVDGTKFAAGYKYAMQLNNRMKYWVWASGHVPEGEGAYAVNKALPPADQLKGRRIFCAGVPNLIRRAAGKTVPTRGNTLYDGGIAAYFYTAAFGGLGPGFFSGVDVPFNLATAKKWARETGSGVLVGRCYRNNSLAGQGHVAILLPDGKVLQSFQFGADGEPGLNTDYTIEQSHAGGYYEVMVHPNAWINHDKGQIRKAPPVRPKADVQDADVQDADVQDAGGKLATRRNGEGDGQQKHPKVAAKTDKDDDRKDERKEIDLEELGREFLALIRKYADRIEVPRRQADVRNDRVEEHQDQR
jgi:GH25 family lysozyme M1 (1,4-beta-N-acetylmuramidase)